METSSFWVCDDKVGDKRPQAADPTNGGPTGGAETPPTYRRKGTAEPWPPEPRAHRVLSQQAGTSGREGAPVP